MKNINKALLSIFYLLFGLLFTASAAIAQDSYVNAFSSVSYDSATNTVSGYAYSQPAYVNAAYYRVNVSAVVYDQNGNGLAGDQNQGDSGIVSVSFSGNGNGCGYYRINSSHWQLETYYVQDYWLNGYYQTGYYDPYNYYNTFSSGSSNIYYGSYQFFGPGPEYVTSSSHTILGILEQWTQGDCVLSPRITSILPPYGAPGSSKVIKLFGNGFNSFTTVEFDIPNSPVVASNVFYISPQEIDVTLTTDSYATAGSIPLKVNNGGNYSNTVGYEIRVPHHLRVLSDQFFTITNCAYGAPVLRQIALEVVDINNLPVGATQVRENFASITTNTCGNGSPVPSSCDYTNYDLVNGRFIDNISVRCNTGTGSCGYDIVDEWQWCPPNRPAVTLATLTETVRVDGITVNGNSTGFALNTMLMP